MIVYIDLYFLMNVQMNLVLLWMEGILLKRKFRFGRFVLAAVVSALLAVLYLVSGIGARWFLTIPFTLSTWFLTIRLAVWKNHKDFFCQELCGAWTAWIFPVWFFVLCGQSSTGGERISFFYGMQWFVFVCSVEKKRDHPGIFKTAESFYPFVLKKGGQMAEGMAFWTPETS